MSDVLASKCQECIHANSKADCEGLTKAEFDANPCHRYKFDSSCIEDEQETKEQTNEQMPVDIPIEETPIEKQEQTTPETKGKETPAEKFRRIAGKRLERCQYELKLLAQLGRLSVAYTRKDGSKALAYEYTHDQVNTIVNTLQNAVEHVRIELTQYAQ